MDFHNLDYGQGHRNRSDGGGIVCTDEITTKH